MARVTQPGGRVLLVVYGPATQSSSSASPRCDPGGRARFEVLPLDPPPLPFQVAEVEKLQGALAGAGLEDVRVETITETLSFRSGPQMWDWLVNSNPIAGMLIGDLSEEQRAQVRDRLDAILRERAGGSGAATLTNPIHTVTVLR